MTEGLPVWVVYDHPRDYPHDYVARMHIAERDGSTTISDVALVSRSLDLLRMELEARGLTCLHRMEGDDPVILETWL